MKVSFVLPAYKRRFLREAIASILSQTYHDFEVVVVDDCSPEDLKSVVKEFHDERLVYHRNAVNVGGGDLVAAWNEAMEYATGEWCVLASDDDVYMPNFLEEMLRLQEKYPFVDLLHGRNAVIDASGTWIRIAEPRLEYESQIQMIYFRGVRRFEQCAPDFMFRRSAWVAMGGFVNFPMAWYSDDASWFLLARNGVAYSSNIVFCWRNSGYNISSSRTNVVQKKDAAIAFLRWMRHLIPSLVPNTQEDQVLIRDLYTEISVSAYTILGFESARADVWTWLKLLWQTPGSRMLKFVMVHTSIPTLIKRILGRGV